MGRCSLYIASHISQQTPLQLPCFRSKELPHQHLHMDLLLMSIPSKDFPICFHQQHTSEYNYLKVAHNGAPFQILFTTFTSLTDVTYKSSELAEHLLLGGFKADFPIPLFGCPLLRRYPCWWIDDNLDHPLIKAPQHLHCIKDRQEQALKRCTSWLQKNTSYGSTSSPKHQPKSFEEQNRNWPP